MATVTMKECDYCGEDIRERAKKCKHCGETLDPALRAAEEAARASRGGGGSSTTVNMHAGVTADFRPTFPHLGHLLMSLVTAGFWVPIWLLHYLCRGKTYRGS